MPGVDAFDEGSGAEHRLRHSNVALSQRKQPVVITMFLGIELEHASALLTEYISHCSSRHTAHSSSRAITTQVSQHCSKGYALHTTDHLVHHSTCRHRQNTSAVQVFLTFGQQPSPNKVTSHAVRIPSKHTGQHCGATGQCCSNMWTSAAIMVQRQHRVVHGCRMSCRAQRNPQSLLSRTATSRL
jgi:hypothetical protein